MAGKFERPAFCDLGGMRVIRKHLPAFLVALFGTALGFWGGMALAGETARSKLAAAPTSAGSVALGEATGGVTDRAYVSAPPNWLFSIEREPGSFLDCGEGMDSRATDGDGRRMEPLTCGVTLTETIAIPAASASARLVIHH